MPPRTMHMPHRRRAIATTMEEVQRHGIPRLVQLNHLLHLRPQDELLREEGTAPRAIVHAVNHRGIDLHVPIDTVRIAEKRPNVIL